MAIPSTAVQSQRFWWPRLRPAPRLPKQAMGLGISGLPDGIGVLPTHAPALLLSQDAASAQSWTPLLVQALLSGGPVLALAACHQDADALWQYPALRQAYDAGQLRVALFSAEQQRRLRRDGIHHLAREVHSAIAGGQASLCMLDARALFAGASVAQLHRLGTQLRRFAKQRHWPTVGLLPLASPPPALATAADASPMDGMQIAAAARSGSLGLGHVATLAQETSQSVLTLHSWDSPQGALFHMRYNLQHQGAVLLYAGSCSHGEVPILVQAPDTQVVYTTAACAAAPIVTPANWVVLPDWLALEQAVQKAVGATLLVDLGEPPQFDELCALVHRLRSQLPASIKIIVRETNTKLRAYNEQALLHLGVTAVAYRELGFGRLVRLIESCASLVHTQRPHTDLHQALSAFAPPAVRGYQPPQAFERIARETLQRSRTVGLTHTLVHLQLLPQIAHLDALKACRALRDGDVVTADAQGILAFMFACSAAEVAQALRNMFTVPVEQLFAAQVVDSTALGTDAMLRQLHQQARKLPDYSAALHAHEAVAPQPRAHDAAKSKAVATQPAVLPSVAAHLQDSPTVMPTPIEIYARPIARRARPDAEAAL